MCRQSLRLWRHFYAHASAGMFSACSLRIMLFPQELALKIPFEMIYVSDLVLKNQFSFRGN